MRKFIIILVLIIVGLSSCHKCNDPYNPTCSNYNPCYEKFATTAHFEIKEFSDSTLLPSTLQPYWKSYNSDTVWREAIFTADLDSATYEWHIGSGVYSSRTFTLNFTGTSVPSVIPVTLIVRKQHNEKCFPGGKDADTVTRNLTLIARQPYKYFLGTYKGSFADNPGNNVIFSVIKTPGYNPAFPNYYLVNFFAQGDSSQFNADPTFFGLSMIKQQYASRNSSSQHYIEFITYVDDDANANCTFWIYPPSVSTQQIKFFKGKKIQ